MEKCFTVIAFAGRMQSHWLGPFPLLSGSLTMKKLLLTLLAGLSIATIAAQRAHADPGDPCIDANGHSGLMISTGRGEVCQAE